MLNQLIKDTAIRGNSSGINAVEMGCMNGFFNQ